MATAKNKPISEVPAVVDVMAIGTDINLEEAIADQLLDDIDWQKVRAALIRKAPKKLFAWLQSQILPIDGQPIITNEIEAMAICEGDSNA